MMTKKSKTTNRLCSLFFALIFFINTILPSQFVYAQSMVSLPIPGTMVNVSPAFLPAVLRGITIHPENPYEFDFIIDAGQSQLPPEQLQEESAKLVRYFLTSLTVPEKDLWVNLSPFEKERIIPPEFGITEMGKDLLSQDYLLKQLTATLIYPEEALGKAFWDRIYEKAQEMFGTTNIPITSFNKVWIVPDKAVVYEKDQSAFIVEAHLKVMHEEDYLAFLKGVDKEGQTNDVQQLSNISASTLKEIIIPEIEKEINHGKNFAQLRQIYHSLILASWYKIRLKESLLNQVYSDQNKIVGVDVEDREIKQKIYEQYLEAYKKGVYSLVKEYYDPTLQEVIPRKYFSGGVSALGLTDETLQIVKEQPTTYTSVDNPIQMKVSLVPHSLVNEYIRNNLPQDLRDNPSNIQNYPGAVIPVKGLLAATGQLAHIGLGQVYGQPVIYIDEDHRDNTDVLAHERFEIDKWEALRSDLGLEPQDMRQWILANYEQAHQLALQWHSEAPSVDQVYDGLDITEIYPQNFSERDVNLAAGKQLTKNQLTRLFESKTDLLYGRLSIDEISEKTGLSKPDLVQIDYLQIIDRINKRRQEGRTLGRTERAAIEPIINFSNSIFSSVSSIAVSASGLSPNTRRVRFGSNGERTPIIFFKYGLENSRKTQEHQAVLEFLDSHQGDITVSAIREITGLELSGFYPSDFQKLIAAVNSYRRKEETGLTEIRFILPKSEKPSSREVIRNYLQNLPGGEYSVEQLAISLKMSTSTIYPNVDLIDETNTQRKSTGQDLIVLVTPSRTKLHEQLLKLEGEFTEKELSKLTGILPSHVKRNLDLIDQINQRREIEEPGRSKIKVIFSARRNKNTSMKNTPELNKLKIEINTTIQRLLPEKLSELAVRYSLPITTIVWGLLGPEIQGTYDRQELENVINQQILSLVTKEGQDSGQWLGPATEEAESTGLPTVFEPTALSREEIVELADNIETDLKHSELDAGIKDLVKRQSVILIKKLEEQYFLKQHYKENPDRFTAAQSRQAIEEILSKESNTITIEALKEILAEVTEAIQLQDTLYENGLRSTTTFNLYQLMAILKTIKLKKVLLADEMGLGKTLETLGSFLVSGGQEMLVLAPKIVLNRWMEDIGNHTDTELEVVLLSDTEPVIQIQQNSKIQTITFKDTQERYAYLTSERPATGRRRIILMNYDILPNFSKYRAENNRGPIKVDFLALDEMHLVKNLDTQIAQAVYGDETGQGAIQADFKMLNSGTPLENKPADLFGPLKFLAKGGESPAEKMFESMSLREFTTFFSSAKLETLSLLHSYIAERMIRRLKAEVMTGLPEKIYSTIQLNPFSGSMRLQNGEEIVLPGSYRRQLDLYELALSNPVAFEQQIIKGQTPTETIQEETGVSMGTSATQLVRMEQAALDPEIFESGSDSIKLDALKLLISERLKENKSVLIWTKYKTAAKHVKDILEGIYGAQNVAYMDGDMTTGERQDDLNRFQNKEASILIMTEVGVVGIETTQADAIILLNMPWKQSSFDQLIDRAHRRDPKRNYPGKKLEIINLEFDVSVSIDRLKAKVIRSKSILSELIVNGNLSPEILNAFRENDSKIITEIQEYGDEFQVKWDNFEKNRMQELLTILGRILHTKDPSRQQELWNSAAEIYFLILQHKGSYFANLANLGYLSSEQFPELKGRVLKTLDLGSGPSTLYRAYKHQREHLKERGLELDITDYDASSQMLQFGEYREGKQILGGLDQLQEAFSDGSFDLINLSFAFRYAAHPAELIRQVNRLLKEGGIFTIILSDKNTIPPEFYKALERAGFELKVTQDTKLESVLDADTYKKLLAEHGQEIADDLAKNVRGQFTYLVVKKARPIEGEIKDTDFLLFRETPKMDPEKVQKLSDFPGAKNRFIPQDAIVDGRIVYFADLFEGLQKSESTDDKNDSIKLSKSLTKLVARISQLSQKWQQISVFSDRPSSKLQHTISADILIALDTLNSTIKSNNLTPEQKLMLQEQLDEILDTPFFSLNPGDLEKQSHREIIGSISYQLSEIPISQSPPTPRSGMSGNQVDHQFVQALDHVKTEQYAEAQKNVDEALRLLIEVDFEALDSTSQPIADMVNQTDVAIWVLEQLKTQGLISVAQENLLDQLQQGVNGQELKNILKKSNEVGGIDFNPNNINLEIRNDGKGISIPVNLQQIQNIHIGGFTPVIINITPVINLPQIMGLNSEEEQEQFSLTKR